MDGIRGRVMHGGATVTEYSLLFLADLLSAPVIAAGLFLGALHYQGMALDCIGWSVSLLVFLLVAALFRGSRRDLCSRESRCSSFFGIWLRWFAVLALLVSLARFADRPNLLEIRALQTWAVVTPFLLFFRRIALIPGLALVCRHIFPRKRAVIAGVTEMGLRLAQEIASNPFLSMELAGFFEDRSEGRIGDTNGCRILGDLGELPGYVKQHGVHRVYITLPLARQPRILQLLGELQDSTASVYFIPDLFVTDLLNAHWDSLGDIPYVAVCESPFIGARGVVKRLSDLIIAGGLLLLLSPLLLGIAVAVWTSSGKPIFFRQRRYGEDGTEILVYKFRTMSVCEDGADVRQAQPDDPRVTPIGRFLRKWSLDELPQLFNVVGGSMSLVGPRPHAVAQNEMYRNLIRGYMIRYKVKPGITGWAQVHGLRGETDTLDKMRERVRYDLDYLRHWSLGLDLWILVKTVAAVLGGKNAY
jgi:putative colanic acid biosynthesis UDP-glucose lipid carrier transferase